MTEKNIDNSTFVIKGYRLKTILLFWLFLMTNYIIQLTKLSIKQDLILIIFISAAILLFLYFLGLFFSLIILKKKELVLYEDRLKLYEHELTPNQISSIRIDNYFNPTIQIRQKYKYTLINYPFNIVSNTEEGIDFIVSWAKKNNVSIRCPEYIAVGLRSRRKE